MEKGGSVVDVTWAERADQLERDFRVPHPIRVLRGALRKANPRSITPFQQFVCTERLGELSQRGFTGMDGAIVLLMRGARRETVAAAMGYRVNTRVEADSQLKDFLADLQLKLRAAEPTDEMIGESQRRLHLWARA